MQIKNGSVPRVRKLISLGFDLTPEAKKRLRWFDHYESHGCNASLTCRYFGISRETFYRWKRRYDPSDLTSLNDRSHRPRRVRRPTWTHKQVKAVKAAREKNPEYGKDKLAIKIRETGVAISVSMTGRILADLKRRWQLVEPLTERVLWAKKKRRVPRPYATRKPKGWPIKAPGDLVQLDTKDVRPLPDVLIKHFSARDVVSRWDVLEAHHKATGLTARSVLDAIQARMPFRVRAIQVDGGSEFKAEFEQACADRGIRLFVLPPRSPKLNGFVESAHACHNREFYQYYDGSLTIEAVNRALRLREQAYNTERPHQSLGYQTPLQSLRKWNETHEGSSSVTNVQPGKKAVRVVRTIKAKKGARGAGVKGATTNGSRNSNNHIHQPKRRPLTHAPRAP